MKVKVIIEYAQMGRITYVVYNSWTKEKLHEVLRKIQELIEEKT